MDHKVSKDMISSGMIPSGEKTQADLGRTQYGSAPSPSSLMEAYRSIYEHHRKDEDGNTIPHEDELDEQSSLPPSQRAGSSKSRLIQRLKDKKANPTMNTGSEAGKALQGALGGALGEHHRKDELEEGMGSVIKAGVKAVKKITKGNRPDKPSSTSPNTPPDKPSEPSKPVPQMNDVDLFDLIKGRLIDEGCEEKEAIKIMANMTKEEFDEISEGIGKAAMLVGGAVLAKKGLDVAKKKFDNFLNKQRNQSPIGGNKRVDDVRAGSGDSNVGQKIKYGN